MTDVNAHPNGELENLIDQQRTDTVDWQRNNNLSPQGESPVVAEVHVSDINEEISDLGQVVLSSSSHRITGSVLASTDDEFWVKWDDNNQTIEKKANYKLVAHNTSPFDDEDERHGVIPKWDNGPTKHNDPEWPKEVPDHTHPTWPDAEPREPGNRPDWPEKDPKHRDPHHPQTPREKRYNEPTM